MKENQNYPEIGLASISQQIGDMGVMKLKQFGEVEGNCPRESPGPTGDFV